MLRRLNAERLLTVPGFRQGLSLLERVIFPSPNVYRQVRDVNPDLVLIVTMAGGFSPETEYQKACKALGIPTVVMVASWDNLTSKGTFSVPPDWLLVWNDIQVQEAIRYHGVPAHKVLPVGAPVFDDVFERDWLVDREAFCRRAGLDPARPYLVYVGSARNMWGDESQIVANLSRELRQLPGGDDIQVLVRPHPKNLPVWEGFSLDGVQIWRASSLPDTAAAKSDLYNTLYHAACLAGLATSAFLEGAILERPGVVFLLPQAGDAPATNFSAFLHFQYLLDGGFLHLAQDEAAGAQQIAALIAGHDEKREARRAFVHSFVRPAGVETPARRVAVETLETIRLNGRH
jgi:hypothetical protein